MPWKIANENGRFQIHKEHSDGTLGEAIGPSYEKRSDALKYLRALYSNTEDANSILSSEGFVPPENVRSAARRGLELREKYGKGGLDRKEASDEGIGSGVQRATNLANGDRISLETVKRMKAFFDRHEKNKAHDSEDDAGWIAWLLWGGDAGRSWANGILDKQESSTKANLVEGSIHFEADNLNPRILHFKDYVLARPETNQNRDHVDEQGIKELADTIPGMPIDFEHDPTKNIGFFTAGRVGSEKELRTDGSVWLDRCEENGVNPDDVLNGKLLMSIEADAANAECSVCHKVHAKEEDYCEHLKVQGNDHGIRSRMKYGAERIMRGLRALGGAFTYKPAGSATGADSSSRIVFAASQLEVVMSENEMIAAVTKSEGDGNHPASHYLVVEDPQKPTTWHLRVKDANGDVDRGLMGAAWAALHGGYRGNKYEGPGKEDAIGKLKALYKSEGADTPGEKNEERAMTQDEQNEMKSAYEAIKKDLEAKTKELDDKSKELEEEKSERAKEREEEKDERAKEKADMESKLQASDQRAQTAETQLTEANNKNIALEASVKAYRVNELRAKLIGSVLDEEEFTAKQEALLALPEDAIELMTRNRTEKKPSDGRLGMAASDQTDTVTVKLYRS